MNLNQNTVQELRDAYGMSQTQLSILMGVSRSLMSLMELELRNWPVGTTSKQIALEPFLLPPIPNDLQTKIEAKQKEQLDLRKQHKQKKLYKTKHLLQTYQEKLAVCKTKEQQAISALRLIEKVKTEWPEKDPKQLARHQVVWDGLETLSWIKLRENGLAVQEDLEEKIAALEAEIAKWDVV